MSAHDGDQPLDRAAREGRLSALVLLPKEAQVWEAVAALLDQPLGVVYRLCALAGAEHYLAELGHLEQAALAGTFLRLFAEQRGIDVVATPPSTAEVQIDTRARRKKRTHG